MEDTSPAPVARGPAAPYEGLAGQNEGYDQPADPPSYSQAVQDSQSKYNMSARMDQASTQTSSAPVSQQPRGGPTRVVVVRRCRTTNSYDRFMVYSVCGFLCCFPLGIAALIFWQKAKYDDAKGRVEDARRNSRIATCLSILAVVGGILMGPICYLLLRKYDN